MSSKVEKKGARILQFPKQELLTPLTEDVIEALRQGFTSSEIEEIRRELEQEIEDEN